MDTAPEPQPWTTAVRAVLTQFVRYSAARMESGDLEECRNKAGVGEATGELFEDALNLICPDEDETEDDEDTTEDEAAPAATGTAGRTAS